MSKQYRTTMAPNQQSTYRTLAMCLVTTAVMIGSTNTRSSAAVTCTTTSKGSTCTIEDPDGNVWITVNWKEHPPADSTSCSPSVAAPGATHMTIVNQSGTAVQLLTEDGVLIEIPDGDELTRTRDLSQVMLNADDLAPMAPGSNTFVRIIEHHGGAGIGREQLLQFGSSEENGEDELTYQLYAVDMSSGERVQDLLTDSTGEQYLGLLSTEGLVTVSFEGDYDGPTDLDFNGTVNVRDLDVLTSAIGAGMTSEAYDLTGDGLLNQEDVTEWLSVAGAKLNPSGASFRPGDSNLDGNVDVADFNIWNANKFTVAPVWSPQDVGGGWSTGDFNADGLIDVGDYSLWNANKFTSSNPVGSKEPRSRRTSR